MIIRQLEEQGTTNEVVADTWRSRRLLLADDGMGFSVHDTIVRAGTSTQMWYRNHLEAVYCIEGHGHVLDLHTGDVHRIAPGTLYALDEHDKHVLHAEVDLRVVCVFNPPLLGPETHDEEGAYPLLTVDAGEAAK